MDEKTESERGKCRVGESPVSRVLVQGSILKTRQPLSVTSSGIRCLQSKASTKGHSKREHGGTRATSTNPMFLDGRSKLHKGRLMLKKLPESGLTQCFFLVLRKWNEKS